MNNIYPILFDELNLLLRFGYISIDKSLCVLKDGNEDSKLVELFSNITPYYDESQYLLLEFVGQEDKGNSRHIIGIDYILKIFPLSKMAYQTIKQLNLDTRLVFQEPVYEKLLLEIESINKKRSFPLALKALRKCLGLPEQSVNNLDKSIIDNVFKGIDYRRKGIRANLINNEDYWTYLLAYDSYNLDFPKSTLGYFYDAGEVFAYSNGDETFVGSKYFHFLENIRKSSPYLKLIEIINLHEESEEIQGYKNKTIFNNLKGYIASPIYLMLKDNLRSETSLEKSKLFKETQYLADVSGSCFDKVLLLLAAFFGFDKFSDAYYDKGGLKIFKPMEPVKKIDVTIHTKGKKNVEVDKKGSSQKSNEPKKLKSKSERPLVKANITNTEISDQIVPSEDKMDIASGSIQIIKDPYIDIPDTLKLVIQKMILQKIEASRLKEVNFDVISKEVSKKFNIEVSVIKNDRSFINSLKDIEIIKKKGKEYIQRVSSGDMFKS